MSLRIASAALACAGSVLLTAAPAGAEIRTHHPVRPFGVDVSSYQHGASLDWAQVRRAGQDFGFTKATEGTGYANPYLAGDWAGMRAVGMARGAYHYARPQASLQSAVDQANYFVAVAGTTRQAGDLAPMLDLEDDGGLSPAQLVAWTHTWLDTVARLTGRRPVIYTYAYFWRTAMADDQGFTGYPLFPPDYHDRSGQSQPLMPLPGGWQRWTFWQYTDAGQVPGISGPVDLDRYNGPDVMAATWGAAPAPTARPLAAYRGWLMREGWVHPAVATLQQFLHITADGQFGPQTTQALTAYQQAHGLPPTGVTDPATWNLLAPVAAPAPTARPLAAYRGWLMREGWVHPAVTALQQFLHITADGQFGPQTTQALTAYQQAHGLPPTGVTDPATWNLLAPNR